MSSKKCESKRKTGIDDKLVFYCRRYSDPYVGSYFEWRESKEICNPNDPFPFYMKIGGVVYLPAKTVPGKLIASSVERIKESAYFGSYVFYGNTDKKLRTVLYARRKGLPDNKLVSYSGIVNNIIPRYDGKEAKDVVIGMLIEDVSEQSDRRWTRYDDHYPSGREAHTGFHEFNHLEELNYPEFGIKCAIYVPENTSVLMVDITTPHLYNDKVRDFVYTVFQSGAIIMTTDVNLWFCFYDEEESKEYDGKQVLAEKHHLLDKSPNLDLLDTKSNDKKEIIIFLKSAPNYTFWTLRVNREMADIENNLQICVPTGGQFEDIMPFDIGLQEVKRRQSLKPWNKYIESDRKYQRHRNRLTQIDMTRNEAYPQMP